MGIFFYLSVGNGDINQTGGCEWKKIPRESSLSLEIYCPEESRSVGSRIVNHDYQCARRCACVLFTEIPFHGCLDFNVDRLFLRPASIRF